MQSDQSRRGFLRTLGAAALLSPARPAGALNPEIERAAYRTPAASGATPKICLGFFGPVDERITE
jgi:hypothetical protein